MIEQLKITLPLPKSVNYIYGRNKFGSTYLKKEGKEYKNNAIKEIKKQVKLQKWTKLKEGEFCYFDTVIYMNKKGRDNDNIYKLLQDSCTLSGVVWYDDTYVWNRTQRSYIDSNNPRVEISIMPSYTIGVFENSKHYKDFMSENCDKCKKKHDGTKGTCRIYSNLLENRIVNEVSFKGMNIKCKKIKTK